MEESVKERKSLKDYEWVMKLSPAEETGYQ